MKDLIPWYVRIAGKVALSRLPMAYKAWKAIGLFSHGQMQDPVYAYNVFRQHYLNSGMAMRGDGFVGLEMGPGDSLLSAVAAKAYGATQCYLIDTGNFASVEVGMYQKMAERLRHDGLPAPDLDGMTNIDDVLTACNARYKPTGLAAYRQIPDRSVDFIWSQAVLEHVRRAEFLELMQETRRMLKPNGVATHQIDLRDHLGGALNNMRLGSKLWEADWMANSGFYTNRIRFGEMCDLFEQAGFGVEVLSKDVWPNPPTPRRLLASEFVQCTDEELRVSAFYVILRPI